MTLPAAGHIIDPRVSRRDFLRRSAAAISMAAMLAPGSSLAALVAVGQGLYWPWPRLATLNDGSGPTLTTAADKVAFIGHLYINGRPAGTKTIDTTGSSSIGFQTGSPVTFANGTTSIDIGLQGVNTSGPIAQPNGTYTAKATVTTAVPTTPGLAANTWCEAKPTSGTASLTNGDLIAVVFTLTAKGGADTVQVDSLGAGDSRSSTFPVVNAFTAAAWGANGAGDMPNVVITFSDGTIGTIDGCPQLGQPSTLNWNSSTNPDEQGLIFQVPFACKIDAIALPLRIADLNSNFTLALYSAAETGSPVTVGSIAVLASQLGLVSAEDIAVFNFATELSLSANTDYCVAIRATGSSTVRFTQPILGKAAHRAFFPGGTTMRGVTRNGGTGTFGGSNAIALLPLVVRISEFQDGSGGASTGRIIGG